MPEKKPDETLGAEASIAPLKLEKSKMAKRRDLVLGLAVFLAILIPFWFAGAALGAKFHMLDWKFALLVMTKTIGPLLIFAAIMFGVIGLILMLIARPFDGWKRALVALIIPGIALWQMMGIKKTAEGLPPIHDIATDPANPLQYSAATLEARALQGKTNPITAPMTTVLPLSSMPQNKFGGLSVADAQKRAYPNIVPLVISGKSVAQVGEVAKTTARQMGWKTITSSEVDSGPQSFVNLETSATTFWYGFTDDVAVSVRPHGNNVRVDVRSNSRVGVSDLGANAKRIEDFLKAVRAKTD